MWQLLRLQILKNVHLESVPSIALLLEPSETLSDMLELSPEVILLRWLNYHLVKAEYPTTVTDFGKGMTV
jgi:plastin-1